MPCKKMLKQCVAFWFFVIFHSHTSANFFNSSREFERVPYNYSQPYYDAGPLRKFEIKISIEDRNRLGPVLNYNTVSST